MRALFVILSLLLAGCAGPAPTTESPEAPMPDAAMPAQVVVTVIDSAVNPYHESYHSYDPIDARIIETLVDAQGRPPVSVELNNTGTWQERRDADAEIWDNIEEGRLYHFVGTRVLGVSFGGNIIDGGSHGTGTTSAVLQANPDAIVVLAQGVGSGDAEQWAATTPWVDLLSESYGLYCGQPVLEAIPGDSTAKNNKLAADNGKLPIGAADNTPCPANNDGTAGPPWVVGVSGDHPSGPEDSCREPLSGNFPDFTADFTQDLPYGNNLDETSTVSGTSFATPTAAGSFSKALLMLREAWGHDGGIRDGQLAVSPDGRSLHATDLRDAFNHTATYFGTATVCEEGGSVPVAPAAPWVQMGWGHIDGEIGNLTGTLLIDDGPWPAKDPNAVSYMEAHYEYRKQVWTPFV